MSVTFHSLPLSTRSHRNLHQFVRLFGALNFRLLHFGGFGFFGGAFEVQAEELVAGRMRVVERLCSDPDTKRSGVRQLYVMRLADHFEQPLTDLKPGHAAIWPYRQPIAKEAR